MRVFVLTLAQNEKMPAAHTVTTAAPELPDAEFDVAVVPSLLAGEEDQPVHLEGTILLKKLLQADGLRVVFADAEETHPEVELNALELILPALVFTAQAVANGGLGQFGNVLVTKFGGFIANWRHRRQGQEPDAAGEIKEADHAQPAAHLIARVGVYSGPDSTIKWYEFEGAPEDVAKALEKVPA